MVKKFSALFIFQSILKFRRSVEQTIQGKKVSFQLIAVPNYNVLKSISQAALARNLFDCFIYRKHELTD